MMEFSVGGPTSEHVALAVGVLVILAGLMVAAVYRMQYTGLSDEQIRHKKALQGQVEDQTPRTYRIDATDELADIRGRIRALFEGEPPEFDDDIGVRDALGEVRRELGAAWHGRTENIPRLTLAFLEEALALAVLGGVAVISTNAFTKAFNPSGGFDFEAFSASVVSVTTEVIDGGHGIATSFPYADVIWALTFGYTLIAGQWLYENPFVSAAVLVAAALGIWRLDRRVPDAVDVELYPERMDLGLRVGALMVGLWLAGVIPTVLLGAVGFREFGALIGIIEVLGLACYLVYRAIRGSWQRIQDETRVDIGEYSREMQAYLVLRRVGVAFAALVAPLILVYAGVIVATGKLVAVLGAFATGSLAVQGIVGGLVLGAAVLVAMQARAAWPDLRTALRDIGSRKAIRIVMFRRVAPVTVIVLAYVVAIGFGMPWFVAVAIALGAGVIARSLLALIWRAKYRVSLVEERTRTASRVVLHAYRLEDADGDPLFVADVNVVRLAHRDPDALVDAILRTSRELFEEGEAEPSVERSFARDLFEYGIVDIDESEAKLRRSVYEDTFGRLKQENGMLDCGTLEEKLEEYPEHIWREELQSYRMRSKLRKKNGYYITV